MEKHYSKYGISLDGLGVTNKFINKETVVQENMNNDIKTLIEIYKVLNDEFFEGKLSVPIITINAGMRTFRKISRMDGWEKNNFIEKESTIGLYFSDKILKMTMEEVFVEMTKALILIADKEKRAAYKGSGEEGNDIENESGVKNKEKKGKYKGLVSRGDTYYTRAFYEECKKMHLIEVKEKSTDGRVQPDEEFLKIIKRLGVDNYCFLCKPIKKTTEGQSMRVYECPRCKLKIRVTKDNLDIRCHNVTERVNEDTEKKEKVVCKGVKFKMIIDKEGNRVNEDKKKRKAKKKTNEESISSQGKKIVEIKDDGAKE